MAILLPDKLRVRGALKQSVPLTRSSVLDPYDLRIDRGTDPSRPITECQIVIKLRTRSGESLAPGFNYTVDGNGAH